MSKLVVAVDIAVKPETSSAFLPLIVANAVGSRGETGCRQFDVCVDADKPEQVFLYELYDDDAAFEAHMRTPHYLEFAAAAKPLIDTIAVRRMRLA